MFYPHTEGHPSKYTNPAVHSQESNSQPDHTSDALSQLRSLWYGCNMCAELVMQFIYQAT